MTVFRISYPDPVRRTKHDGRSTRRAPPTLGLGRCSASLDWTVRAPFSVPCDLTLDSVAGAWEPREAWERLGNTKAGPGGSVGYGATRAKGPDHCRMSACPEPQRCEGLGGPGNKRDAFGLFCTAPARLGVGKWDSGLALAFIVACSVAGRWTGLDSPACPLLGRRTASGSGLELASRSAAADLVATEAVGVVEAWGRGLSKGPVLLPQTDCMFGMGLYVGKGIGAASYWTGGTSGRRGSTYC
ncbi:hypothetical protein EDB80DRAFT_688941 [Ilyonectria destructans]|nr:hypothetical protein EDB80DRAFT_688941 [Ilyonectria destructans]